MSQTTWAGVLAGPPVAGDTGMSPLVSAALDRIAELAKLDPARAKRFVRAVLPLLRLVSAATPNPFDDVAVALLDAWANS